ncbi:MAG: NADH-quinone oxidoreductase subunit J [Nitriliruptorales bacterium]
MRLLLAQVAGWQSGEAIPFWVLSVVGVGAAIGMVTTRNVVHGALMLVLNFAAMAGLFLLLQAEFLAIVQIIVYAGAIMVLFLFVIMLLGVLRDDELVQTDVGKVAGAWLLALGLVAAVTFVFVGPYTGPESVCSTATPAGGGGAPPGRVPCVGLLGPLAEAGDSVVFVATRLFNRYTFAFEFISLLLVVAIIAALVVGRREDRPDLPGGVPSPDVESAGLGELVSRVAGPSGGGDSEEGG